MNSHKHAEMIHAWADGAEIEFFHYTWKTISNPSWDESTTYRIKPRTVTRTITYPAPLTIAPAYTSFIWFVWPHLKTAINGEWHNHAWQNTMLKNGMCFATEADAQACYDSLFGKHV